MYSLRKYYNGILLSAYIRTVLLGSRARRDEKRRGREEEERESPFYIAFGCDFKV